MFLINGVPLLQRNIELMRDQMGIRDIVIITGHLGFMIEDYFGNGSRWGVQLRFIRNTELELGLSWSIFLSRELVDDYFCVILGDEYYQGSNHRLLKGIDYHQGLATCAVKKGESHAAIKENYGVRVDEEGNITSLTEKPVTPENNLLGCGTFILSPTIFPHLESACLKTGGGGDFISLLNGLCEQGYRLKPFWLEGGYVNINDRKALEQAALLDASGSSR